MKKVLASLVILGFLIAETVTFAYNQEVGDGGIASIGHGNTNTVTTITGGRNQVEINQKAGWGAVLPPPEEKPKEVPAEEKPKEKTVEPKKPKEKLEEKKGFPWAILWIILGALLIAAGAGWIVFFRAFKDDDEDEDENIRNDGPKPNDGGGGNIGTITITDVDDTGNTATAGQAAIAGVQQKELPFHRGQNTPQSAGALPPSSTDAHYGGDGLTLKSGVIRVVRGKTI